MKRVTGIGGIFFKAKDPAALGAWYKEHLGIDVQPWGGALFRSGDDDGAAGGTTTAWNITKEETTYFAPSDSSFMVNYRVADLDALVGALRAEGCTVVDTSNDLDYGKFAWVMDPEGNKVELWEPPAEAS